MKQSRAKSLPDSALQADTRQADLGSAQDLYVGKRDFSRTSEPTPDGSEAGRRPPLRRANARARRRRRLYYDLRPRARRRAPWSWAVPNGPSYVARTREAPRCAHRRPSAEISPPSRGRSPKGEYGGGAMIVWDRGAWRPVHDPHKSIAKGHLEFELDGERLKGRWHLVRTQAARAGKDRAPGSSSSADDSLTRATSPIRTFSRRRRPPSVTGYSTGDLEAQQAVRARIIGKGR